jgi:hypothetical protein
MWQTKIAYLSNEALKGLGVELYPTTKDQRLVEGREVRRENGNKPRPGKRTREEAGLPSGVAGATRANRIPPSVDAEPNDK